MHEPLSNLIEPEVRLRLAVVTGLSLGFALLMSALLLAVSGCDTVTEPITKVDAVAVADDHLGKHEAHSSEMNKLIAELRQFSATFHNVDKAKAAGYTVNIGCIDETIEGLSADDARGMGYHVTRGDVDIVGDGRVDAFEPEFLVYSKHPTSGKLQLAAFDYFVPGATWTASDPPEVLGMPLHWHDLFQGWVLHIWHWKDNPDGMFDNYNPRVPLCDALLVPEPF